MQTDVKGEKAPPILVSILFFEEMGPDFDKLGSEYVIRKFEPL